MGHIRTEPDKVRVTVIAYVSSNPVPPAPREEEDVMHRLAVRPMMTAPMKSSRTCTQKIGH
jgi:hypothetical protein